MEKNWKHITKSFRETEELGESLGRKLIKEKKASSLVLALVGDLGGGKTTFLKGFAKGIGIRQNITSPTFIIFKRYRKAGLSFYHFDCYRIKNSKEILSLGFEKIASSPKSVLAIEWAERIKRLLPEDTLFIIFKFINENKREILIKRRR